MKDIEINRFSFTNDIADNQIIRLEVRFLDRLKFLFKGSKIKFIIHKYKLKEI